MGLRGTLRCARHWLMRGVFFALAAVMALILLFRFVNPPPGIHMISERMRLGGIERQWVPIGQMSEYLPLSAAAAEDADFCRHWGFDIAGIRSALADGQRLRGGSTISQQVAKNVFLWPDRTWARKGLEAGMTVLIEALWPKRRIMEVYLNVAETGEGVFGVEAAARHYWKLRASDMGPQRSSRLMAVLPNPKEWSPVSGSTFITRRGAQIESGAATIRVDGRADCFL